MAKRKRLGPAQLTGGHVDPAPKPISGQRPPIAEVAHDAVTIGALQELSDTITTARDEGRWIERLALDSVIADHLVRDRIDADVEEMEGLKRSLQVTGQQTAIEVVDLGDGKFGLISGWRRLTALKELSLNGGLDTVLALVRKPKDAASAYQAMVEENEIRANLSFYERGRIVARAVDRGVYPHDRSALKQLFHAVPRAKRSKIGSFVRLVRAFDDVLQFPTAMSERAGLALAQRLDADPDLGAKLAKAIDAEKPVNGDQEQAVIARLLADAADRPKPALANKTVLRDGLYCQHKPNGQLVLGGVALSDPAFVARIIAAVQDVK